MQYYTKFFRVCRLLQIMRQWYSTLAKNYVVANVTELFSVDCDCEVATVGIVSGNGELERSVNSSDEIFVLEFWQNDPFHFILGITVW